MTSPDFVREVKGDERFDSSSDLYGAMLSAVRAWLERHHPGLARVTLVGEFAPDLSAIQIPVTTPISAS